MAELQKFMFDVDFFAEAPASAKDTREEVPAELGELPLNEFNLGLDDQALEEVEYDGGELTASEKAALQEMSEASDDDLHVDLELDIAHEPEPPPPPTFSEEEMNVSRQLAFQEGHQIGQAEAAESIEAKTATALDILAGGMDQLFRAQEESADRNARDAVRVAMSIVRKLLPSSFEQFAEAEIAHAVGEVIGQILDEPRIIVRVAQTLETVLKSRLEQVVAERGFEGRVVVQADSRIAVGDCRVEWTDGGAERDQARLLAEIEGLVERSLTPAMVSNAAKTPKSDDASDGAEDG